LFKLLFALWLLSLNIAQASTIPVLAINAGSSLASGSFQGDAYFSGGSTAVTDAPINLSNVTNPAPLPVYQSNRYANSFSYVIGGLMPGVNYVVRLHFAEVYWNDPGARRFNVFLNGNAALTDFDIFAAAGGKYIAVVREFTANANNAGNLVIDFTTITDNAQVNGIEILRNLPPEPAPVVMCNKSLFQIYA
jgi:hypothetical protein